VKIELVRVPVEGKERLWRLLQLYLYDFTEFEPRDVGIDGTYAYPYFDSYWEEPDRHPFLILVDGETAGLVLICGWTVLPENRDGRSIGEFFIMRSYRRQGIGTEAARRSFDMFPGRWEVRETGRNYPSQKFWRDLINDYTEGNYDEIYLDDSRWRGPIQSFDNSKHH
jgi:predicted acetyltransferase